MKLVSKVTEIYCVANYCCPVKVLQDKKIRLKPSCRIPASFVTLLVAKNASNTVR